MCDMVGCWEIGKIMMSEMGNRNGVGGVEEEVGEVLFDTALENRVRRKHLNIMDELEPAETLSKHKEGAAQTNMGLKL